MTSTNNLILHQSNRLEDLALLLGQHILEKRKQAFSLEPDLVLVNNREMAQWLSIVMADQHGICANIRFALLGSFIWDLTQGLDEDTLDIPTRQWMQWMLFQCLKEVEQGQETKLDQVLDYLESQGERGLYHLSVILADLFDKYMNYRHDMLLDWEEGQIPTKHNWQAILWRKLTKRAGKHLRIRHLINLLKALQSGRSTSITLPDTIFIFGMSYMPPIHLDIISALATNTVIHLFVLNPCKEYWLDIEPERIRATLKKKQEDPMLVDSFFPVGNRLLATLGNAGKAFLAKLYELPLTDGEELFDSPSKQFTGLLHQIQKDILELKEDSDTKDHSQRLLDPRDNSIRIFNCHSRLREVEVLHDQLVHLFNTKPDIFPQDILIMAPAMEKYAPIVEAVFGSAPKDRFIPYSIADLSLKDADPICKLFLNIFSLPNSEFTSQEVMDILSHPQVMKRLGLDQEAISSLKKFILEGGIRRGLERLSNHADIQQNTWSFGLKRLFSSYSMACSELIPGLNILPLDIPIEGGQAQVLAILSSFIHDLTCLHNQLKGRPELSPRNWMEIFNQIIYLFISKGPEEDPLCSNLTERLDGLIKIMEKAQVQGISYEAMIEVLEKELSKPSSPRAFITGKVLFSSLVPMRTIPYKVIYLLGMNDSDFPRQTFTPSFDIMATSRRVGDRMPRDEDRYLFLETLISAREHLWLSYVGRSQQDNQPQNPSVVVTELMGYIQDRFVTTDGADPLDHILVKHPLQPFSLRYLQPPTDTASKTARSLISYATQWLPVDESGKTLRKTDPPCLCPEDIHLSKEELKELTTLTPSQFASFFSNPVRFFLQHRLKLDLFLEDATLPDTEPLYIPKEVTKLFLKELLRLEEDKLQELSQDPSGFLNRIFNMARAKGVMPISPFDKILWEESKASSKISRPNFENFIKKEAVVHGLPDRYWSANLTLGQEGGPELTISGPIGKGHPKGGLLEYRHDIFSSHKISFWISHLLLMSTGQHDTSNQELARSVTVVVTNTNLEIDPVEKEQARTILEDMVRLYYQGLKRPLPFFTNSSLVYAKEIDKANSKKTGGANRARAIKKAIKKLFDWQTGAITDNWVNFLLRGQKEQAEKIIMGEDEDFHRISLSICGPFLGFVKKGK